MCCTTQPLWAAGKHSEVVHITCSMSTESAEQCCRSRHLGVVGHGAGESEETPSGACRANPVPGLRRSQLHQRSAHPHLCSLPGAA